jgi:hypothetical protein
MDAQVFFPFPFDQSNDTLTLEAFLRLWQQKNRGFFSATRLCEHLVQYHPQVANMLEMHCSFYNQPSQAVMNLHNMTEAFQSLIGCSTIQTLSIKHLDL